MNIEQILHYGATRLSVSRVLDDKYSEQKKNAKDLAKQSNVKRKM